MDWNGANILVVKYLICKRNLFETVDFISIKKESISEIFTPKIRNIEVDFIIIV